MDETDFVLLEVRRSLVDTGGVSPIYDMVHVLRCCALLVALGSDGLEPPIATPANHIVRNWHLKRDPWKARLCSFRTVSQ